MSQFAAMVLTVPLALTAADAQVQSIAQRTCIGGPDEATARIVSTQWKAARKCLSQAASAKPAAIHRFANHAGAKHDVHYPGSRRVVTGRHQHFQRLSGWVACHSLHHLQSPAARSTGGIVL